MNSMSFAFAGIIFGMVMSGIGFPIQLMLTHAKVEREAERAEQIVAVIRKRAEDAAREQLGGEVPHLQ